MQASKVILDPSLLSTDLSKKQKSELRKERALEFIKSKPNGSIISQSEFVPVTGLPVKGVSAFLKMLEKDGLFRRERITPLKTAFYITDNIETRHVDAELPTVKPEVPHMRGQSISDLAKEYYWQNNDDSLHKFVEWVAKLK